MFKLTKRQKIIVGIGLAVLLLIFFIPIPKPLFLNPYSTILEAKSGELLSAKIAKDGQWRFPKNVDISDKFENCILYFEDEYFYYHLGINPISILRALKQNIQKGKIVSGGSTLSMQVARMARNGKERTIWQKLVELVWTIKIEMKYSKKEILQLYAAHAPFGGNVVGLEAASWRYYFRPPSQLSWAETATLAVLPNAPSLIFPGKNQELLLQKRNRLLKKLYNEEIIDKTTYELSLIEELPLKPNRLPQEATHLLNRNIAEGNAEKRVKSTLDIELQRRLNQLVRQNYNQLKQNQIHNLAVLVLDNRKNQVLAYVGNSDGQSLKNGHKVDIITAKRSTGSLLKPFLYGLAWQDGLAIPTSILPDIPTQFGGYAPKNFDKTYDGAVPSSKALIRSLNIPSVRLQRDYGIDRFYADLSKFPLKSINKGADHYGLSLILGGAEASLWEMCNSYKGLSNSLDQIYEREYQYSTTDYDSPKWEQTEEKETEFQNETPLSAGAVWQVVESLKNLNRPGQEEGWESFAGRRKVAWKTGTSFGLRDAWAIGFCPEYTIGVWVGNADGEGRPGLTGLNIAAPILFDAYELLPQSTWYKTPYDELMQLEICAKSGFSKGINCVEVDTVFVSQKGLEIKQCLYHQLIQLDKTENERVNSTCYQVADIKNKSFFVLPPLMEWYFKKKEPNYQVLPNWKEGCQAAISKPMELVSPVAADQVLIPVDLEGEKGFLVVEVAHSNPKATIYWYLNDSYLGETKGLHLKEISPPKGNHILTLVDNKGLSLVKGIEVL